MTVVSMLGGVLAYTRTGSVPSILASFTIGGALAMSSMRIKDGLDYGIEGAARVFVSNLSLECGEVFHRPPTLLVSVVLVDKADSQ